MKDKPRLRSHGSNTLNAVNGQPLSVLGCILVDVRVCGTLLPSKVRFFVVDHLADTLSSSVLLGLEFVLQHIHSIHWSSSTFSLRTSPTISHPLVIRQATADSPTSGFRSENFHNQVPVASTAYLVRTVTIKPYSNYLVNVVTSNIGLPSLASDHSDQSKHQILFEPDVRDIEGDITIPVALVSPQDGVFPILMHNPTAKYLKYPAGMSVGRISQVTVPPPQPAPVDSRLHPSRVTSIVHDVGAATLDTEDSEPTQRLAPPEHIEPEPDVIQLGPNISINLSGTIPLTPDQRRRLQNMLARRIQAFAENATRTPTTKLAQHRIDTGDHLPVSVPPYRVGPSQRAEIDRQAQEMLDNGVTRPSNSPYSSPALLVKKSDGTMRFCVDFRRLNAITKKDVYPLPRIDDMLDALGKADYFTTIDLQSGFWQIPLHPDDIEKTAFSTARGHHEFVVMPFGLCNAPATFQRVMDQLLRDMKEYCLPYMDDIVIFTQGGFEQHLKHVENVLKRLESAPMVVKPKKFKILQGSLKFLGHIISPHCIKPDPEKTSAVHAFPTPTCVKELQSFIGLVGYYRRFVPRLATIAEPLYHLMKNDVKWSWGPPEQAAMDQLKSALTNPPILRLPDFDRDFVLHTDASDTGLGAVLSQYDGDVEHPVYYASKTLNPAQRHYSATARECLAVKWACDLFRPYLIGRPFKVYTDHAALKWLFTKRDLKSMLVRWILELQEYDMTIIPRPGVTNGNADALSRLPALLETNSPVRHSFMAITRTQTGSRRAMRRDRANIDSNLALDPRAYDLQEALRQSQGAVVGIESSPSVNVPPTSIPSDRRDESLTLADAEEADAADIVDMDHVVINEDPAEDPPSLVPGEMMPLSRAQRLDPALSPIINYLQDEKSADLSITELVKSDSVNYRLFDNVLYHVWNTHKAKPRLSTSTYRAVIPQSMRSALLKQYHDGVCGAHLGESKTYERIADKMYWPGMYEDIKTYVRSCVQCAARKTTYHHSQLPLGSLPRPTQPFEALGIDILGPLPKTRSANQYILVVTDYHTRWPMAFPMKNQRAATVASLLVEQVFCQHGFPATLLSDQGKNFMSELMRAVLDVFHVKKVNTTAYHPQTNGLTERFNHTLCTMLTHYTNKQHDDWDTYLPYVLLAYRTTPHHTLKETPFYMLYGRNVRFPFDQLIPAIPIDDLDLKDPAADHINNLVSRLKVAQRVVDARLAADQERRRQANDALTQVPQYEVGDFVWVHNPHVGKGHSRKLTPLWRGPYEVIDKFNNRVNYKVHPLDRRGRKINNAQSKIIHVARMKRYYHPDTSEIRLNDLNRR